MADPSSSFPKMIAYLRVSTLDQDLEKNKADILRFANDHDLGKVHFVEEIASGRTPWRARRIAGILEESRAGDALIVAELSRLGRSMLECVEILALATRQGLRVYAVKGNWQLDQSLQSKIIALAFSMAAEIERDLISQRTREALRFKKAQDSRWGGRGDRAKASWTPSGRKSKACWPMARPRRSLPGVITPPRPTCTTGSGSAVSRRRKPLRRRDRHSRARKEESEAGADGTPRQGRRNRRAHG
jgi:DNA invertase Pin-like site-specific DNA recombinase